MITIYSITNKINGKAYVGQTKNYRARIVKHRAIARQQSDKGFDKIHPAMREFGLEQFEFNILELCAENIANERECFWIERLDSYINGYNSTPDGKPGTSYWTGRKRDAQTKEKISQKLKGISWGKHSPETRKALSVQKIGNKNGNKKVICVETGAMYSSVKEAGKAVNVSASSISHALKGNQKTAQGYHWIYANSGQETIPEGSTLKNELPAEARNIL